LGVPPLVHTPRPARRPKPNADSSHDVELLSTALAPHHFWLLCTGIMLFGILSAFASAPDPDAHGCQITQALGNHTVTTCDPPPIFTCAGSIGNQALAPDEGMLPTAPHSELLLLLLLRLIPGSPSAHCPRRRARRRNHRVCTLPTRSPRPHRLPGSCVSSHSPHSHYRHVEPAPGVGPCFRLQQGRNQYTHADTTAKKTRTRTLPTMIQIIKSLKSGREGPGAGHFGAPSCGHELQAVAKELPAG
jgi:hypothetical protein